MEDNDIKEETKPNLVEFIYNDNKIWLDLDEFKSLSQIRKDVHNKWCDDNGYELLKIK